MNFKLNARSGETLIGIVDIPETVSLPPGVHSLPPQIVDFRGIYQTDKRAMASLAGRLDLQILYESENWLLFG